MQNHEIQTGWIVLCRDAGSVKILGIYATQAAALIDAALMGSEWTVDTAPFLGFGLAIDDRSQAAAPQRLN